MTDGTGDVLTVNEDIRRTPLGGLGVGSSTSILWEKPRRMDLRREAAAGEQASIHRVATRSRSRNLLFNNFNSIHHLNKRRTQPSSRSQVVVKHDSTYSKISPQCVHQLRPLGVLLISATFLHLSTIVMVPLKMAIPSELPLQNTLLSNLMSSNPINTIILHRFTTIRIILLRTQAGSSTWTFPT